MKIFSYDSRFSQVLMKLSMACWLNLLWMLCSIPIFTMGAATTALYAVTLKIADDEDGEITKRFFSAFKSNFAQATRIWLILLAIGALLAGDAWIASRMRHSASGMPAVFWTVNLALIIAAAIAYVIVLLYVYPLTASVENTDLAMIRNSFLIGVRYLFCSILLFAIHFAMFFLVVAVFTPLILFGEGLCALLSSYLLIRIIPLVSYRKQEDVPVQEDEEVPAEETAGGKERV